MPNIENNADIHSGASRLLWTEEEFWRSTGIDETSTLEFKIRLVRPQRLQESLVAFANARGGRVIVGISETHPRTIVGITADQAFYERVEECARITHPPLHLDVDTLNVGARTLAAIRVVALERGWVQTSDGRLIVRAGPTNRTLVGMELARFVQERGADPVEDQPVRGAGVDDLQQDALRRYVRRRLTRTRVNLGDAVRDLGLVTPTGDVRLATLLLFGKRPQAGNRRFGIEILRFQGPAGGTTQLRDRKQLTGTLPALVQQADEVIYDEMRRDAVIRGLVREEVPEFPPIALREALLNAVGHRDYSLRGAAVEIRLFDDAVEIESPGSLAGYVTLENLRDAQYSRNERMMDAFHVLGLVEEAGTGIDRMYSEMEDALLDPPEFEEKTSSFVVRFRGRSVFAAEDRLWIARFSGVGLSADEKVALVYARRHETVTNQDLQELRQLDSAGARAVLRRLTGLHLLHPIGRGRGTRYVLGGVASRAPSLSSPTEHVSAVVSHARRVGSIANRDVRGLLGVDSGAARSILEFAVGQGLLHPVGQRRARVYLPTPRAAELLPDPQKLAYLTLVYSPSAPVMTRPENEGFTTDAIGALLERLREKGYSFEVLDTTSMSDDDRFRLYVDHAIAAAGNRYRVRRVFGSNRAPGQDFGRHVPALVVSEGPGERPTDVYPHETGTGEIITIAEYLHGLA